MAGWDPARARQLFGLTLSDQQKQAIHAKLPPSLEEGVFFADGVFEGGGVLGIAFLGAARCCSDLGIRWKGLAGTSAGAITASLLASDLTIDRLEQILGGLDFNQFLSQKTSFLVRNGDPRATTSMTRFSWSATSNSSASSASIRPDRSRAGSRGP